MTTWQKALVGVDMDEGLSALLGLGKFHHASQNSIQFKTYDLFIAVNFLLIFSDHSLSRATD